MNRKLFILSIVVGFLLISAVLPVAAQSYETYVTQSGDTLSKIADRFCTTWQEIYAINRQAIGDDPNQLYAGKVLTVPNRCGSAVHLPSLPATSGVYDRGIRTHATGSVQGNVYSVAWGDTLFSIGQRFGVSVDALVGANYLANANNIYAGLRLLVPGLQSGGAVPPPVVRPPSAQSRTFGYGECTIQFNSTTNIWNTPNGNVIASVPAGTSPARQVQNINSALWYQIEYLETTPWVPAYLIGTVGNCGL